MPRLPEPCCRPAPPRPCRSRSHRPTRPTYRRVDVERADQRVEGDAGGHLGDAGEHRLRRRSRRGPVERHGERAGNSGLRARGGRDARSPAGHTLPVTFTPADAANYAAKTASVSLGVLETDADHHVAGAGRRSPTARRSGATQLNASASEPGTFAHTPAASALLNAGLANLVGDLHADRRHQLRHGDGDGCHHGPARDHDDHLDGAGRYRLRHGAGRDATRRDGERAGHLRVHARRRGRDRRGDPDAVVPFTPTDAANYAAPRLRRCRWR